MKKNNLCAKTKINTIFLNQGGWATTRLPPPPNDVPIPAFGRNNSRHYWAVYMWKALTIQFLQPVSSAQLSAVCLVGASSGA